MTGKVIPNFAMTGKIIPNFAMTGKIIPNFATEMIFQMQNRWAANATIIIFITLGVTSFSISNCTEELDLRRVLLYMVWKFEYVTPV